MKAITYEQYGSPDVLRLAEVEKPAPKDHEVLVKVYAAAANPADWHLMRGDPFFARFETGFPRPKNAILGADVAGRVEAVGGQVTQFRPGDEVFGDLSGVGRGAFAEYVCVPEKALVIKPGSASFESAAAVPLAGITALQGLRDSGQIQAGQRVLVNGASGGVGTFAVQLARYFGAEVTGVCSTRNLDLLRSIGADHVIDYTREDFTRSGTAYDLIYDAVGNRSVVDMKRALATGGVAVVAGFTTLPRLLGVVIKGWWASRNGEKKIGLQGTASANQKDMSLLAELLEADALRPVIDRCYDLHEAAEAIRYLETGRARGKVIISITR